MPTPSQIIDMAASLMNDTNQSLYTDAACLPYLNMALNELQENFELNNIPITNDTSTTLNVPLGTSVIGAATTPPLPTDLIEIQQLWESPEGLNQWIPMTRKEFLPHNLESVIVSNFGIWAWIEQEIKLIAANVDIDLKIDYVKYLFSTPIVIGAIATNLPVMNSISFLGYRTAALCSQFIGENPTRAVELNRLAQDSLDRSIGISTKGKQSITTRRKPFMAGYKSRGY